MTRPILYGSPRLQSGGVVRGLAVDVRNTNLGYNTGSEPGRPGIPPPPPTIADVIQGDTFGYVMSGNFPTVSAIAETKQKFSLVSETPAVPSPGDLIIRTEPPTLTLKGVRLNRGHTSGTAGFQSGGTNSGVREEIMKFPFANEADVTESNQLGVAVQEHYAMSAVLPGYGYALGGQTGTPFATDPDVSLGSLANQKFSFVSGGISTVIGNGYSSPFEPSSSNRLKVGVGHSSATDGYHAGGGTFYTVNRTGVFPFSSDVDATLHGSLNNVFGRISGSESTDHGYLLDGTKTPTANVNTQGPFTFVTSMSRYPFANGTTSVTIGDATNLGTYLATGVSGETKGYSCGGYDALPSFSFTDNIMSHEYASSTNGTDVASLLGDTASAGSTQV